MKALKHKKILNKKIILIIVFVFTFFFSLNISAATTTTSAPTTISISTPGQGQVITSNGFTVAGKAPAEQIIEVTIQDEDYQNSFQVHQQSIITNLATTSDKNGDWVAVPTVNLVPGRFSVMASFQNGTSGIMSTDKIFFSIADNSGSTVQFTIPVEISIILVVILLILLVVLLIFRSRRNKHRNVYVHTSQGDIQAKEIIDPNDNIEVVPLEEPKINLNPTVQQNTIDQNANALLYQELNYLLQHQAPPQNNVPQQPQTAPVNQAYQQPIQQNNVQPQAIQPTAVSQQPSVVQQQPQVAVPPQTQSTGYSTNANNQSHPLQQPGQLSGTQNNLGQPVNSKPPTQ